MPQGTISGQLGLPGWLATLSTFVGLLVRVAKVGRFGDFVPKKALPWVALALGFLVSFCETAAAYVGRGRSLRETLVASSLAGLWGVFAGAGAVAGNETVIPIARAVLPEPIANLLFSKKRPEVPAPALAASTPPDLK